MLKYSSYRETSAIYAEITGTPMPMRRNRITFRFENANHVQSNDLGKEETIIFASDDLTVTADESYVYEMK